MRIGRDLTIKGDLAAAEDFTVDFTLEGSIDLPGYKLMVEEAASVQARVTAASVVVRGRLDGHVATDRLEIASTGSVQGSVVTSKLLLQDGALLNGPVNTERAQAAGSVARHKQKA
ncbi:MAG TPA: polymer-forming cytoskeletal protein [Vicinamibacterales bacterium]|jgi:cytoskeletal protein CcmA (bactofilin family)